jgi:hypothetical protein
LGRSSGLCSLLAKLVQDNKFGVYSTARGLEWCQTDIVSFKDIWAYAHILDQRRVKFDDKSLKLIFIGYDERSKAYKIFYPTNKKMHISHDVQVNKEAM